MLLQALVGLRRSEVSWPSLILNCGPPKVPWHAGPSLKAACRGFRHAHDVALANGEIDVLDLAGYGSLIMTKAIIIQDHSFSGISVGASGTPLDRAYAAGGYKGGKWAPNGAKLAQHPERRIRPKLGDHRA